MGGVIYLISNTANGKQYIGQMIRAIPSDRFDRHLSDDANSGKQSPLCSAIRKYGREAFKFEVIWVCPDQGSLNSSEEAFIQLFETMYPKGYNLQHGGAKGRHSATTAVTPTTDTAADA